MVLRSETITFTRHDDGAVTADHFPKYTSIHAGLMASADPEWLHVEWVGLPVVVLGVRYLVVGVEESGNLTLMRVPE